MKKKMTKTAPRIVPPQQSIKYLLPVVVVFLAVGLYFVLQSNAATFPTTRDKYKWPFSRYSIWNMPIGKNATYVDAQMDAPANGVHADANPISLDPNAPVVTITNDQGTSTPRRVHLANGVSHDGGWNGCSALLSADDPNRIAQGQPLNTGSKSWIYDYSRVGNDSTREITNPLRPDENNWEYDPRLGDPNGELVSLTGYGRWGCHGATATSGLGGAIRKGELDGPDPIRHVLKFQPYCHKYCHRTGKDGKPWRWPSYGADSYALTPGATYGGFIPTEYMGRIPDLQQGSLLALKEDFNINSLSSNHAKKIAQALIDYGAYMVDDSAQDNSQWTVETGAAFGDGGSFGGDISTIIQNLYVVANNSPTSVGGGGDPRVCYAPDFSNGTDDISVNPNGNVQQPDGCPSVGGTTPTPTSPTPTPTPSTSPTPTPTTTPTPNSDADITGDGIVGVLDLAKLISNYNKTTATKDMGDLNNDGSVTLSDLSMLVRAWGT